MLADPGQRIDLPAALPACRHCVPASLGQMPARTQKRVANVSRCIMSNTSVPQFWPQDRTPTSSPGNVSPDTTCLTRQVESPLDESQALGTAAPRRPRCPGSGTKLLAHTGDARRPGAVCPRRDDGIPSAAWRSPGGDPWLCVPTSRSVCPYRGTPPEFRGSTKMRVRGEASKVWGLLLGLSNWKCLNAEIPAPRPGDRRTQRRSPPGPLPSPRATPGRPPPGTSSRRP